MLPTDQLSRTNSQKHNTPSVLQQQSLPPTVGRALCALSFLMKASVIKPFPMLHRCVFGQCREGHTERMCTRLQAKTTAAVNKQVQREG